MAGAEDPMLPVRRVEMVTGDIDLPGALGQLYARHRPRVRRIAHAQVDVSLRAAAAGPLNAGLVRQVGFEYQAQGDPPDWLLTAVISTGTVTMTTTREQHAVARGGVILFPLTTPFTLDARSAGSAVLRIPVQAAAGLAEEQAGLPAADLRFESIGAISDTARGRFAQTTAYICAELVTSGITAFSPLIAHEMTRLAASVMLATFPNTTMTTPYLRGPGHVTPSAARRAAEFIDSHAGRPLTLADIAAQADVTPRALQYAFRRHYDAAPMSYLRRVRLERAHAELQAADPAAGHTVAAIARRWGFARPDRFVVAYRAVYGRPPSHTLRG